MVSTPNRRTVLGATAGTVLIGALAAPSAAAEPATIPARHGVRSPGGLVRVTIRVVEGRLRYEIARRGRVVVASSGLGIDLADHPSLTSGLVIESVERRTIDETWRPVWGPDELVRNHANECVLHTVQPSSGLRLDLVVRVFDDGVGFRYHLPAQAGLDEYVVTAERTEFALPATAESWSLAAGTDWNADERHYRQRPLSEVATAQTPLTFATASGQHVVVHEAALIDYPSMTLAADPAAPGVFTSELISLPDGTKARLSGEFSTPWRTLTIGERPGDLAESHLIENLNEPCALADTSWISAGTYVGVWWELQRRHTTWTEGPRHGATTERVKQYIDLAKEAGASNVLAEGWNTNAGGEWTGQDFLTPRSNFDIDEVLRYARENGVGFIAHNETRGFVDYYEQNLDTIFARYAELGIHSIKTGYATRFELGGVNRSHYDQEAVRHYQRVIETAARHQIMINAHEAIKPTGLARTYPNMMTGEGVAGMEQHNYMGANGNPPAQATILPFTRFMGGPADYTPGVLNVTWDPAGLNTRVQTTSAAQLALYSVFFSPAQMLADTPENYRAHPGFAYLKDMPASWDETRFLDCVIGDYTVAARRKGDIWYLGAITDEHDRTLRVPLRFLGRGRHHAEIYRDGPDTTWKGNPLPIEVHTETVRSSTVLTLRLVAGGGTAIRFRPL
ncbi:glycoside hydrolase family 97 protein [Actinoalloteichus hymeniacidonis]|uniref:Glycoside hydrolase n=1 Tax=Actinoalloteichus hymeniacidonis TaxID=340345 RepID=A0AAC9HNT0_9PSEU|nr:glycoside hydrolase family 97 protein [Actinoalloteichus hymeniacidonis]AOS62196.1 glycoside hydrolase [Actinoalloteichus hymeniacidonis]MBB5909779.1 alpha-glucosidase [Actinoalloteichus hymeniacidonis]